MHIKRYLKKNLFCTYFQLKGIGPFFLAPLIGLYILTPCSNYITWQFYREPGPLYTNILKECQFFFPLLSVWYLFFVLEHYVEEPGHELLYVGGRNKLPGMFLLYGVFLLLMLPLFFVYTRIFPELWWLYLKIAVVNLFYFAMVYLAAFLSGKITVSVLLALSYTIYVIAEESIGRTGVSYYRNQVASGWDLLWEMKGMLLLTVLFFIAGSICNYLYPERSR